MVGESILLLAWTNKLFVVRESFHLPVWILFAVFGLNILHSPSMFAVKAKVY